MHTPTEPGGPLQKRLEAFIKGIEGVEAGDVQAVHQTRVASRRLRELLPLLALDHDVTRTLSRRLRKVTKLLGNVREFDVLLLLVRELAEDSRYSTASLRPIGAAAAQARVNARERLSARLPRAKLERLARRLERASKNLEPDKGKSDRSAAHGHRHTWLWALDARLVHRAVRLREAIEAAGAVYAPEHLHRVRIAVKKLRYAAELVGEVTRRRMAADVAALKAAQDRLGRLHDLGVLIVRAREAQARLSPPDLTTWRDLSSLVHAVDDDCRRLHARYMRDRAALLATADRMAAGAHARPHGRRASSERRTNAEPRVAL